MENLKLITDHDLKGIEICKQCHLYNEKEGCQVVGNFEYICTKDGKEGYFEIKTK